MPKFTKKPVTITAVQFNGSSTHANEIARWIDGQTDEPKAGGVHTRDIVPLRIRTMEGVMEASPNDWIIKGIKGEFYPCKPEIFKATYELAE